MYSDRDYETLVDEAREAEAKRAAPDVCYAHGLSIGRAVEAALVSLEKDGIVLRPVDVLYLEEAFTEATWDVLEDEVYDEWMDYDAFRRGLSETSPRYAAACIAAKKRETA